MLKNLVKPTLAACWTRLVRDKSHVFFVYGMRRSGNHACIHWLVNALEGEPTTLTALDARHYFNETASGRTVTINNIGRIPGQHFFNGVFFSPRRFRQAENIIVSVEDHARDFEKSWRVPQNATPICVRRSTPNVMASRYQRLNQEAQMGKPAVLMSLGPKFIETYEKLLATNDLVWDFERWQSDPGWRAQFLGRLGLSFDYKPGVAPEGEGSSYSGTSSIPSTSELLSRFKMTKPHGPWRKFLGEFRRENPHLLTAEEIALIDDFLVDEMRD